MPPGLNVPVFPFTTICIPLKSGVTIIGVIGLGSFDASEPFGPDDMENMSCFAELASVALDNARLNAGMSDYVSKPVNPSELIEKIEQWIGKCDL